MSKKINCDFLEGAKYMPPLRHSYEDQEYEVEDSDVCDYLCSLPEVMQKVFDLAKGRKVIVYDKETGMWRGSEWNDR